MSEKITPASQVLRPRTRSSGKSVKRYTPYRKTPRSRLLHVPNKEIPRTPVNTSDENRGLSTRFGPTVANGRIPKSKLDASAIINKAWRVFRMSPLYDFSYTPAQLKKFSRFLSAHMEAESMKGYAVGLEADVAKSATFSVFPGLRVNQGDPESIHITVKGKPKEGKKDVPTILEAFLLSVNIDDKARTVVKEEFTYYPVLLVKGSKTLTGYLCAFLETQFDCHIKDMAFSSVNLGWMVAMWSGFVPEKKQKPVQLSFKVPPECEGLSQISLSIDAFDCKDLWDCISDVENEEFHENQVTAFMRSLESHFYQHFKVNLTKLTLNNVATTVAQAGSEGKIKMFSGIHMQQVLQFLTHLSGEKFLDAVVKNH